MWYPYKVLSSCDTSYFLTILDDYSWCVWIFLLRENHEVAQTLKQFFSLVRIEFDKQVKVISTDNGTEFMCLKSYFFWNMAFYIKYMWFMHCKRSTHFKCGSGFTFSS